ncbi:YpoC family protein [Planococcus sp. SE5232]|uniref:YpoC family protein n=1 Tax=unclassified Planococcus (in: firmicutes) TaxID=2662419 RepID=UPI003D6B7D3F
MKSSQKLTKDQLEPFFQEWNQLSTELADLHHQRNRGAKDAMQAGLKVYNSLLAHCREALQDERFEPLNGSERLSFIQASPGTYAAYRQMDELFSELKKTLARKRIERSRLKE